MLTVLFWLAFAVCVAAILSAASDVWLGRSDAAGRGLSRAFALLLLPFPVLALVLFLASRSTALRVTAVAVVAAPLVLAVSLSALRGVVEWRGRAAASARGVFREKGPRALAEAEEDGRLERARNLVTLHGVDPNARGRRGETPLWFALRKGRAEEAAALVALGADPLLGPEGEPKALTLAAQDPAFAGVLGEMLRRGTSPDATDDVLDRPTPLLFLAMNTNARPNIRVVVEAGAQLTVLDLNGRTPLARAVVWRMWEEALLMVERGAPVAPGQPGPANLEATLGEVVPPAPGDADRPAFDRLVAALAARGLPVPAGR
ncbi:MAG: ankyrin repeat domain-containing protein [Acidobacteria bacterium ACB2]|nr:ankyrin repeat domain-containing protein [Acidobacteria bacterium ACB2]